MAFLKYTERLFVLNTIIKPLIILLRARNTNLDLAFTF